MTRRRIERDLHDGTQAQLVAIAMQLGPEVVAQLMGASRRSASISVLSSRERSVLALTAEGRSNAAIAKELVISEGTVEKHVASIFMKFDLAESQSDHRRVARRAAISRFVTVSGDTNGGVSLAAG